MIEFLIALGFFALCAGLAYWVLFVASRGSAEERAFWRAYAMAPIAHWESNKRIEEAVAMNRLMAQAERDNDNFDARHAARRAGRP